MRDVSFDTPKANHGIGFEHDKHGHADIFAQFKTEPEPTDAYGLIHEAHVGTVSRAMRETQILTTSTFTARPSLLTLMHSCRRFP
jgi:hypothetical protein